MNTGRIYSIKSNYTDLIYIGSTTRWLKDRFYQHKNKPNHSSAKEIMKYPDAYIELMIEFQYNDIKELRVKEGEMIRSHKCVNKLKNLGVIGYTGFKEPIFYS
jgi:hypothetical protein